MEALIANMKGQPCLLDSWRVLRPEVERSLLHSLTYLLQLTSATFEGVNLPRLVLPNKDLESFGPCLLGFILEALRGYR